MHDANVNVSIYHIYKYINSTDLILIEKSMFYNCACVNVSMGQHIYIIYSCMRQNVYESKCLYVYIKYVSTSKV